MSRRPRVLRIVSTAATGGQPTHPSGAGMCYETLRGHRNGIVESENTQGSPTPVAERLERWLRERGASFRLLEHAPVFTSDEAACVRGTPIEAGAKALVLRAEERTVHVVLPGHRKVDN